MLDGLDAPQITKRSPKLRTETIGGIGLGIGVFLSFLALGVYLFRARCCVARKKDIDTALEKEKESDLACDVESGRSGSGMGHVQVRTPAPVLMVKRVEGDVLVAAGWNEGFRGGKIVVGR